MTDVRATARAADAELILRAAIAAADPVPAVRAAIAAAPDLRDARLVHILALGKAAAVMADAARAALPRAVESTLIIVPHGTPAAAVAERVRVIHAAHPTPDATSVAAADAAAALLSSAVAGDVVIVLISGGASSLCAAPLPGITIEQYGAVVHALLHAGADIVELNTVRRHIDRLKGGGMARLVAPARALGLVVSDVVGNLLHIIASGPLSPGITTPSDARRVLDAYGLWPTCPEPVKRALENDSAAASPPHSSAHVALRIIVDNRGAIEGAARRAARMGYTVRIDDSPVTGSARDAGSRIALRAMAIARELSANAAPLCLLSGGETTVMVQGAGVGGRNQELVLAAALELRGVPGITIASVGTDGVDGPSDAAGAVCDGGTVAAGAHAGADAALALDHNDSHSFFTAAERLIRTGPTGTNVMDVQVALIDAP